MSDCLRIAMWSGPRNISTAMMRAWESRSDTCVVDEPLYAHYLQETGLNHPGREEILASQNTNWREVIQQLTQAVPDRECRVFYQKHMTHHQISPISDDWFLGLANCFLIRNPDAVVASYAEKRPELTAYDLGYEQQRHIFTAVRNASGEIPPVIDSDLFLENPRKQLEALCQGLQLAFDERMLSWKPGRRESDGVWAKYWYHNVEKSQGFAPRRKQTPTLNNHQQAIADACRDFYIELREYAIETE